MILVTGGTGNLGGHVVRRLIEAGREVRVVTRQSGLQRSGVHYVTGDLITATGLDAAVEGVVAVVHCAGSSRGDEVATRNLVDAATRAGRPQLVYVSVVGADRIPVESALDRLMFSYFAMKRQAEEVVADSGLPWTILRATQFYELVFLVVKAMAVLPIIPVPSEVRFQPVEADEVAARLVELVLGPPSALVPDFAGPGCYATAELLRTYLDATHRRRMFLPVNLPGRAAAALRAGANLAPQHATGERTWEEFLADELTRSLTADDG